MDFGINSPLNELIEKRIILKQYVKGKLKISFLNYSIQKLS